MTITYGAHGYGLLRGYVFSASAGKRALDLDEAVAWLARVPGPGS